MRSLERSIPCSVPEVINHPLHNALVKIIPTQLVITAGCFHFKDPVAQFQNGNVKGSTAKVKDEHRMGVRFIQAISQGGRGRFVDDP